MADLAQNQLEFQKYNKAMNGPSSPVDMKTLESNALEEAAYQAATGKIFDTNEKKYIEKEEEMVDSGGGNQHKKRKGSPLEDLEKTRYEVYTTSPIADDFGSKSTKVIYMGKDYYPTAKEARDVADNLREKGMETRVYSVKRRPIKNRKTMKKTKKPRKKKEKLKCLDDYKDDIDFGDWQVFPSSMNAKGKQRTWWIPKDFDLFGDKKEPTKEEIRTCALSMKSVLAKDVVEWLKNEKENLESDTRIKIGGFLLDKDYQCNANNKAKIRQTTMRIRRAITMLCIEHNPQRLIARMAMNNN